MHKEETKNIYPKAFSITRSNREKLLGNKAKVIWLTGLSGAGKSYMANALEEAFHKQGVLTFTLDGDNVRQGLNNDLGFSEIDRIENIRRIGEVAKLMTEAGLVVITSFISPFRREREWVRNLVGASDFIEIYISTPLEICEQQDIKGLYKKAREGKISNMTGINSIYEPPERPAYEFNRKTDCIQDAVIEIVEMTLANNNKAGSLI